MTVGERLCRAREKLKLTQAEVAAILGKSQPTIHEWETNKSLPKTAEIRAVAKAYGLKPEAILPMPPTSDNAA